MSATGQRAAVAVQWGELGVGRRSSRHGPRTQSPRRSPERTPERTPPGVPGAACRRPRSPVSGAPRAPAWQLAAVPSPRCTPSSGFRYVAQASGVDQSLLAGDLRSARSGPGPRRMVTPAGGSSGAILPPASFWWLCGWVLTLPTTMPEAWRAADEIDADRTAAELSFALPGGSPGSASRLARCRRRAPPCRGDVEARRGRARRGLRPVRVASSADVDVGDVATHGLGAAAALRPTCRWRRRRSGPPRSWRPARGPLAATRPPRRCAQVARRRRRGAQFPAGWDVLSGLSTWLPSPGRPTTSSCPSTLSTRSSARPALGRRRPCAAPTALSPPSSSSRSDLRWPSCLVLGPRWPPVTCPWSQKREGRAGVDPDGRCSLRPCPPDVISSA